LVGGAITAAPAAAAPTTVTAVDFEDGTTGTWTQSGSPTLAVVDSPDGAADGKVLSITRAADYEGIQSPTGIFEPGATYEFSMRARLGADATGPAGIRFVAKPAYTWIGDTTITSDAWTVVTGTWTAPADGDPAALQAYIGTADLGAAYQLYVDDLQVTTQGAGAGVTTVAAANFDDQTLGTGLQQSGGQDGTLTFAEQDAGFALQVNDRATDYTGIQTDPGLLVPGTTYTLTASVRLAPGAVATQARWVGFSHDTEDHYDWVGNADVTDAGWTTLSGEWTVPAGADATTAKAYIGTAGDGTFSYLIDDVEITAAQDAPGEGPAAGTVIVDTDFEDGTLQGWAPRQPDDTAPTVTVVDDGADGTAQAAQVSDRDSDGDGLQFDVSGANVSGATLQFEAWVRFAAGQPAGEMTLSARTVNAGATAYSNLSAITGARNDGWVKVGGQFTVPSYDTAAELYFETRYNSGNVSTFQVDQVRVWVPEPNVVDTSLEPLQDSVDIPGMGVAIDSRETTGNASELLLHHFDQITAENSMKVESWYDADKNFRINPDAVTLLDYASENHLRMYGHVLVWHSQTPAWFFQRDDGTPLTSSDADKQFLRDRLKAHIDNVARAISENSGLFGSATNPMVAFDVVNEVIADNATDDGLRRSPWYAILGEEYIADAFEYADQAFNQQYAAEGSDRPVKLFVNEYNTETDGAKLERYHALVERLLAAGVPVDGVGHQFHSSLSTPASGMDAALTRFEDLPVVQAVTELDATIGTPVTEGNLIKQGYWYRDAFNVFRKHADDLMSVTLWGLQDARSWRSAEAPLLFDGELQAKYAYFGAVGDDAGVPPLLTAANVFGGDVPLDDSAADSVAWRNQPAQRLTNGAGSFVPRWTADHLTLLVTVAADTSDAVEVSYGDQTYGITRAGVASGGASGVVFDDDTNGGWRAVLQIPLDGVAAGDTAQADVRVLAGTDAVGAWNTPGSTGTLTFLEDLSTVDVVEAGTGDAPVVDGIVDDVWQSANVVHTGTTVAGAADGAQADVRTLWQGDDTLYVLYQVTDPVIDLSSSDPWNRDSVELFLDLGNTKADGYGPNDAQLRISVDNETSFGTGDAAAQAARLTSATARTDTGYVVELAVQLAGQSGGQNDVPFGGADTFQGVDFQVNDGRDGARYAVHTWAEPTGTGYQTTARWGVAHLIAAGDGPVVPEYDAWDAARVYLAGDRVVADGRVFEAQWWTQGQAPDTSGPWGSWMEQGAVVTALDGEPVRAWTSSWVFVGGDVVAYDGALWRARWWTRNQAPGDPYGPWERIGSI
jgi:endo-1,4-beta-xylanase